MKAWSLNHWTARGLHPCPPLFGLSCNAKAVLIFVPQNQLSLPATLRPEKCLPFPSAAPASLHSPGCAAPLPCLSEIQPAPSVAWAAFLSYLSPSVQLLCCLQLSFWHVWLGSLSFPGGFHPCLQDYLPLQTHPRPPGPSFWAHPAACCCEPAATFTPPSLCVIVPLPGSSFSSSA